MTVKIQYVPACNSHFAQLYILIEISDTFFIYLNLQFSSLFKQEILMVVQEVSSIFTGMNSHG